MQHGPCTCSAVLGWAWHHSCPHRLSSHSRHHHHRSFTHPPCRPLWPILLLSSSWLVRPSSLPDLHGLTSCHCHLFACPPWPVLLSLLLLVRLLARPLWPNLPLPSLVRLFSMASPPIVVVITCSPVLLVRPLWPILLSSSLVRLSSMASPPIVAACSPILCCPSSCLLTHI